LIDYLRVRQILLILDNCEHLIEACAQLIQALLQSCSELYVMATSREVLKVAGELSYHVPPLAFPQPGEALPFESLTQYETVRLFIERAATALPDFAITDRSGAAVAQICYQLDGIPLAIELAATRVKLLQVDQIAARLDDRFRLLTSSNRTALPRHQTLRAAIDWSYNLLSEEERRVLRRLAVFAGGWTLEAAEAVGLVGDPRPGSDGISQPGAEPSRQRSLIGMRDRECRRIPAARRISDADWPVGRSHGGWRLAGI
jgi:predicted ATPase